MDNSLLIGKYIYKLLSEDEMLKALSQKIYPLVAKADTTYPFVVYARTNLYTTYCKDGIIEDTLDVQVIAVSDNYVESLEVANQIRNVLELKRYKDDYIYITDCRLSSATEEFIEDAFIQRMTFTIKIG